MFRNDLILSVAATSTIALDPGLDPQRLQPVFKRFGRLHVPGVFTPAAAAAIAGAFDEATGWKRSIHLGPGQDLDIPIENLEALPPQRRAEIEARMRAGSRDVFSYLFDALRVSDALDRNEPMHPVLLDACRFVRSPAFLDFVRVMTGDSRPMWADMMASRYLPGHFLTTHDDEQAGHDRLYAYVLGFSPQWRTDWGGLLMFVDPDGHVSEAYTPTFNSLNIFKVPQPHAVSLVAHFAQAPRHALTGWLHGRPPAKR